MNSLKKVITSGILSAVLGYATPAHADFISGEVFGNNKGTLLEVKGSASIGDQPNAQYFTRVRRFRGYDDKNASFMQNEVSLGCWHELRLLGQGRLVGDTLVPQAGVSYFTKSEKKSLYIALTSSLHKDTLPELLILGNIPMTQNTVVELEQIISANQDVAKATSRAHLGYTISNFTLGVAGEADYGKKVDLVPKIGLYVRLKSK